MARRSSPALYELIRHRGGERVPPAHHREPETEVPEPIAPSGSWLRPGRSIQMPVGYIFVGIALVLGVMILTYMIAYERGIQAERYAFEEEYGMLADGQRTGPLLDPLAQGGEEGEPSTGGGAARQQSRSSAAGAWGAIEADPRERGRAYFILAETTASGATRLAEFCRENGLEAYVVSGHNARLRRVIVLPGFAPDRTSSPEAGELRQRIHDIGRTWTQAGLGRWDYHEAYLSVYR